MSKKSIYDITDHLKELLQSDAIDQEGCVQAINELIRIHQRAKLRFFLSLVTITIGLAMLMCMVLERGSAMEEKVISLENTISLYEKRDSIFVSLMGLESPSSIVYRVHNGKPVTYATLNSENDSLSLRLSAILANYPIDIVSVDSGIYAQSLQIDSALMLLPLYRDRITYDERKQCWIIVR